MNQKKLALFFLLAGAIIFGGLLTAIMFSGSQQKEDATEWSSSRSVKYELPNFIPAVWSSGQP